MNQNERRQSAKQKYEATHGIRNASQYGEAGTTFGTGRSTNQIHTDFSGQSDSSAGRTESRTGRDGQGSGSVRERDRSQREYDGTHEFGSRSVDQSASGSNANLGFGAEQIDESLLSTEQSRIINVANVAVKRGRGRPPKPKEEKKPTEVRAVVVDVLKGPEVEATRARLRSAFIGVFKATDDFINLTVRDKPPEKLEIWSAIDDADIDTLVNARINNAQKSVLEARIVRGFITVYEQFATGFITLPRVWMTYNAYGMYGFQLPGSELWPKNRRRRNIHVVESQSNARSGD